MQAEFLEILWCSKCKSCCKSLINNSINLFPLQVKYVLSMPCSSGFGLTFDLWSRPKLPWLWAALCCESWDLQCLPHFSAADSICANELRSWDCSSSKSTKAFQARQTAKSFKLWLVRGLAALGFSLCLLSTSYTEQLLKRGTAVWKKGKKNYPILHPGMGDEGGCWSSLVL